MNPLRLNHSVLSLIGVCAPDKNTPVKIKIRNLLFYALMLVMQIINTAACSLYVVKYMSIDYNGAIYGLLATTVLICLEYTLIALRFHYKKLRTIFSTLHAAYQKCKCFEEKAKEKIVIKIKNFVHLPIQTKGQNHLK